MTFSARSFSLARSSARARASAAGSAWRGLVPLMGSVRRVPPASTSTNRSGDALTSTVPPARRNAPWWVGLSARSARCTRTGSTWPGMTALFVRHSW